MLGRWLTLGNQLGVADQIAESDLAERILEKYGVFLDLIRLFSY